MNNKLFRLMVVVIVLVGVTMCSHQGKTVNLASQVRHVLKVEPGEVRWLGPITLRNNGPYKGDAWVYISDVQLNPAGADVWVVAGFDANVDGSLDMESGEVMIRENEFIITELGGFALGKGGVKPGESVDFYMGFYLDQNLEKPVIIMFDLTFLLDLPYF